MPDKGNWFVLEVGGRPRPYRGPDGKQLYKWRASAVGPFTKEEAEKALSEGEGTFLEKSGLKYPLDVMLEHLLKVALTEKTCLERMLAIAEEVGKISTEEMEKLLMEKMEKKEG